MPLYEYLCATCDKLYEKLEPQDARRVFRCECGGLAIRVISLPSAKTSKKSPDNPLPYSSEYSELVCGE